MRRRRFRRFCGTLHQGAAVPAADKLSAGAGPFRVHARTAQAQSAARWRDRSALRPRASRCGDSGWTTKHSISRKLRHAAGSLPHNCVKNRAPYGAPRPGDYAIVTAESHLTPEAADPAPAILLVDASEDTAIDSGRTDSQHLPRMGPAAKPPRELALHPAGRQCRVLLARSTQDATKQPVPLPKRCTHGAARRDRVITLGAAARTTVCLNSGGTAGGAARAATLMYSTASGNG